MRWVGGAGGGVTQVSFSSSFSILDSELSANRRRGRAGGGEGEGGGAGWAGWLAAGFQHHGQLPVSSSPALQAGRRRCSTATPTVAVRRRIQPLLPPPVSTPPLVQVLRPWLRTRTEQNCSASAPPCLGCCVSLCFFFFRPPFLTTHCDYV